MVISKPRYAEATEGNSNIAFFSSCLCLHGTYNTAITNIQYHWKKYFYV